MSKDESLTQCSESAFGRFAMQVLRYGIDEVLMMSRIWTNSVLSALEEYRKQQQQPQAQKQTQSQVCASLASRTDCVGSYTLMCVHSIPWCGQRLAELILSIEQVQVHEACVQEHSVCAALRHITLVARVRLFRKCSQTKRRKGKTFCIPVRMLRRA
eukprot:450850-Pelagomonas_calceolata.AAC.1